MLHMPHAPDRLTYHELVERYGETMAYGVLLSLESSAKLAALAADLNEEQRLERVIEVMNKPAAA